MAPPTYDATKHHIGLKQSGGTMYGFMLEGGYSKEVQKETTGDAPDFGGSLDLIADSPRLARWTQDEFVGGMYAYNWGRDDAMFADCLNFTPGQQSRSLISCPPVALKEALDSDGQAGFYNDTPRAMVMVGGDIFIAWRHAIAKYDIVGESVAWFNAEDEYFRNVQYEQTDQMLWVFSHSTVPGDRGFIRRLTTDLAEPAVDSIYIGPTGTNDWTLINGSIFNQNVVCQIGRQVFAGTPPGRHDPSIAGVIEWRKIGRLPGRWWDSVSFGGLLYILINDGGFNTQLWAFDQDTIFPICEFPFNFYGKCMIEYAGRLYVGGTGTDVNGVELYGELYEVTGSSVRLVRTFAPEVRNQLEADWPTAIDDLVIHEGMLWMAEKGRRLIAYDVTSDGFFGASEIQGNANLQPVKFTSGRGRIWTYAVDTAADAGHGIYRIAQVADTGELDAWYPTLVTSDFVYEIAKLKRWSEIQVMTRYAGCSSIEYSVDSGETWTALTVTSTNNNKVYFSKADLTGIAPSKIVRFRIKVNAASPTDAVTYHRELVSFTVSYSMVEETRKLAWAFTINGAEEIETRDAEELESTTQVYDVSDVRDTLWTWVDDGTPLIFKDIDGSEKNVKVESFRESQPLIGPKATGEATQNEALYVVQLLEV